jgi:hypothetical protein
MLRRLVRTVWSWFSRAEDPEVMLLTNIEQMRNTLPRLNMLLVTSRGSVLHLELDRDQLRRKDEALCKSIEVDLADRSDDARKRAESRAVALVQVRRELKTVEERLADAQESFERTANTVEHFKSRLAAKIERSRRAIQEARQAAILRDAAAALEQFGGGVSSGSVAQSEVRVTAATADEYLEKVSLRIAEEEASLKVGGNELPRKDEEERGTLKAEIEGMLVELGRPSAAHSGGMVDSHTADEYFEGLEARLAQARAAAETAERERHLDRSVSERTALLVEARELLAKIESEMAGSRAERLQNGAPPRTSDG